MSWVSKYRIKLNTAPQKTPFATTHKRQHIVSQSKIFYKIFIVIYTRYFFLGTVSRHTMAQYVFDPHPPLSPVAAQSVSSQDSPEYIPPKVLTKDFVFYQLQCIRIVDVTVSRETDNERIVKRVLIYKKGSIKWVYENTVPYTFLGRLVERNDYIPINYEEYFGIKPTPPSVASSSVKSSPKSVQSEEDADTVNSSQASCMICMEDYTKVENEDEPLTEEQFDRLPFIVGLCGHKVCRSCWRKNSSMVVNNAAPGYGELHVLCDAVCPFCKGPIDMVSKDRENMVRQWQDPDEVFDDEDTIEPEDANDVDYFDGLREQRSLCGYCRQPGHNIRTCPVRIEYEARQQAENN